MLTAMERSSGDAGDLRRNAALWISVKLGLPHCCQSLDLTATPVLDERRLSESAYIAALGFLGASQRADALLSGVEVGAFADRVLERAPTTAERTGWADDPVILLGLVLLSEFVNEASKRRIDVVLSEAVTRPPSGAVQALFVALACHQRSKPAPVYGNPIDLKNVQEIASGLLLAAFDDALARRVFPTIDQTAAHRALKQALALSITPTPDLQTSLCALALESSSEVSELLPTVKKRSAEIVAASRVDVLVIVALKDELDGVMAVDAGAVEKSWSHHKDSSGFRYYRRSYMTYNGNTLRFAAARAQKMAGESATRVATRLVGELKPRCLAMTGICAGRRGKVELGDLVVGQRLYEYDAGKLIAFEDTDGNRIEEFLPDIEMFRLDSRWAHECEEFDLARIQHAADSRPLCFAEQEEWLLHAALVAERGGGPDPSNHVERSNRCPQWAKVLERLWKSGVLRDSTIKLTDEGRNRAQRLAVLYPDGPPPRPKFRIHVAPMATGSSVVVDDLLFDRLEKYGRKLLAIDMEASAIVAVAEAEQVRYALVAKCVQDFADADKDDLLRRYAARVSAEFVFDFLREQLEPEASEAGSEVCIR